MFNKLNRINMKKIYITIIIILSFISSCITTITISTPDKENGDDKGNENMLTQRTTVAENCYVYLTVKNNAPNVTLTIDSCFVYNYDVDIATPCIIETGDEVTFDTFTMNLHGNGKLFFLLYGKLDTTPITLYDGLMYVPVDTMVISEEIFIELELYDNCPWYYEYEGRYMKVLQSIEFSASVDNWDDIEINVEN